jgi:hypothetical protein
MTKDLYDKIVALLLPEMDDAGISRGDTVAGFDVVRALGDRSIHSFFDSRCFSLTKILPMNHDFDSAKWSLQSHK